MKIDFHVHSKFSHRPSYWILQKLDCPESFTEPLELYRIARQRGMSAVTITDHNRIEGALEIAHLPHTFVSEEVTTYFPEGGCKLHVLALNITESQHREIQRLRENIYDLVAYLTAEAIFHVVAHPLYAVNDRLTLDHFEKMLLLFDNFELNGTRGSTENQCLIRVLNRLTAADMEILADKHRMEASFPVSQEKRLFGGSDDHSSLYLGRTCTEIEGADAIEDFFGRIDRVRLKVHMGLENPMAFAHNLYGIAWQFYRNKFSLERYADKDLLMQFLDRSLTAAPATPPGLMARLSSIWVNRRKKNGKTPALPSLMELLRRETRQLIQDHPDLTPCLGSGSEEAGHPERRWFRFVNQASNRILLHFTDHLMDHLAGGNVFSIFHTIGSAGGLFSLLSPYFLAYAHYSKDRHLIREVAARFGGQPDAEAADTKTRVAHFTDTFYEVNGVARTLHQSVDCAIRNRKDLTMVLCDGDRPPAQRPGIAHFKPVGVYELPEYPEQKLFCPPLLEMLAFCYQNRFSHIHTSTPGPIGLAALAIARILRLPISGTYHTAIPQYARILTGDEGIADLTWRYTLWYYDQLDWIYAPSGNTRKELIEKGLAPEKIRLYPRGIDIDRFHPAKRNGCFAGQTIRDTVKLLYVGRVSREKGVSLLVEAFHRLHRRFADISLVVVGDGPYLEEMKASVRNLPVLFTGYLDGEELAGIYASSDLFVFPSGTDTFGNVVLEAQASGLPVVVTDRGGPVENMLPGETGVVARADDLESLCDALAGLLKDPARLRKMGRAARRYMEGRSFDAAFLKTWRLYEETDYRPGLRAA